MDDSILLSLLFLWRSYLFNQKHTFIAHYLSHICLQFLLLLSSHFYFLLFEAFLEMSWLSNFHGPDAFSRKVWFEIKAGSPPPWIFSKVWTIHGKQTSGNPQAEKMYDSQKDSQHHLQNSNKSTKTGFFVQKLRREFIDFKLKPGFVCLDFKSSGFSLTLKLLDL